MTFSPHLRLTMSGTISGGAEIFSMNLSLVPDHSGVTDFLETLSSTSLAGYLVNNLGQNKFDDIVADCQGFFSNAATGIWSGTVLQRVKLATIKADGHYASAPMEAAVNTAGGGDITKSMPWQISQKCTMETDADLGRVKGGFYLPTPCIGWSMTTDLFLAADVTAQETQVQTLINNLNDVPGFDTDSYKVVVASQGRHNKDGSVRLAPGNHEVKRVHLGRRPDVQRRRANNVPESRVSAQVIGG